jgi:hypothetical protein
MPAIADASAAQAGLPSQTSDQGAAAAPARPLWSEPPIASVNTEASSAIPNPSQTETVQPTADTGAADGVEGTAQGNFLTSKTGIAASLISTPVTIFPVAALGLVLVGFLLRVMVKMVAARRQRIAIDRHDLDRTEDRHENELRDEQFVRQHHGLSDYLRHSNIPIESRIEHEWPDNSRGRMPASPLGNKVSLREHRRIDPHTGESERIDNRSRHGSTADRQQRESARMDSHERSFSGLENKVSLREQRPIDLDARESGQIDNRSRHGSTAGRQQRELARIDSYASSPLGNKASMRERRRIEPNARESDWIDNRSRHASTARGQQRESTKIDSHESAAIDAERQATGRNAQQSHASTDAGDELINDLQNSLTAAGSHHRLGASVQADDEWANKVDGKNGASSDEITEREEALERLRRDLDRLLESPKVA